MHALQFVNHTTVTLLPVQFQPSLVQTRHTQMTKSRVQRESSNTDCLKMLYEIAESLSIQPPSTETGAICLGRGDWLGIWVSVCERDAYL